jgi:hypothetical protein
MAKTSTQKLVVLVAKMVAQADLPAPKLAQMG